MSRDRGNLTWARRQWKGRTSRAVAREQGRCSQCGKKDKTGLLEGRCTSCFVTGQDRATTYPAPQVAHSEQQYELIRASGEVERGPVVLPAAHLMQTVCNLLNVEWLSQISTVASDTDYAVFGLANAADYALPNLVAAETLERVTGKPWTGSQVPYGPVVLITRPA